MSGSPPQDWSDIKTATLLSYRQEIDLKRGLLLRTIRFEDVRGRRTSLREERLVSMADMHIGALDPSSTAENWSGRVTVRSALDGRVANAGAKLYGSFKVHREPLAAEAVGEDSVALMVRTRQSHLHGAEAARTRAFIDGELIQVERKLLSEPGLIGQTFTIELAQGSTLSQVIPPRPRAP